MGPIILQSAQNASSKTRKLSYGSPGQAGIGHLAGSYLFAESFGCVGLRVEKPGELNDTLKSAFAMNKPVVVDVVTDTYAVAKKPWAPN